jgi:hypothetical protein
MKRFLGAATPSPSRPTGREEVEFLRKRIAELEAQLEKDKAPKHSKRKKR